MTGMARLFLSNFFFRNKAVVILLFHLPSQKICRASGHFLFCTRKWLLPVSGKKDHASDHIPFTDDRMDDLSCVFAMTHQDGTLKIDIRVTDDQHVMNSDPENGWRDDSIQIGFASLDGKYTEVTLSGKADGDGAGAVFAHSAVKEEFLGQWSVPCRIVREGKITLYQAELQLAKLGIADESGTLFRFAFLVNENDGKGRIRWMEWMGGIGRAKNPDEFGWGCLE